MQISLGRPLPAGVGRVSQWFGANPAYYQRFGLAGHNGIDYAVTIGAQVLAVQAGILLVPAPDPDGYGIYVILRGREFDTLYAHLEQVLMAAGQAVEPGVQIAVSGNSGFSTGPHLHLGLRVHGMRNPAYANWIDPVPFRT